MSNLALKDLYGLMLRECGDADPLALAVAGFRWVMDLDAYKQIRTAALAAGAVYPPGEQDPETWVPKPEDRLFGLPVDVREDGAGPHLERAP